MGWDERGTAGLRKKKNSIISSHYFHYEHIPCSLLAHILVPSAVRSTRFKCGGRALFAFHGRQFLRPSLGSPEVPFGVAGNCHNFRTCYNNGRSAWAARERAFRLYTLVRVVRIFMFHIRDHMNAHYNQTVERIRTD